MKVTEINRLFAEVKKAYETRTGFRCLGNLKAKRKDNGNTSVSVTSVWDREAEVEYLRNLGNCEELVAYAEDEYAKHGSYATDSSNAWKRVQDMLHSPEIQNFLTQIGGTAEIHTHTWGDCIPTTDYCINFHYQIA